MFTLRSCGLTVFVLLALFTATVWSQPAERAAKSRAALAIEASPKLRESLEGTLFRELKEKLPATKIDDATYYFIEGDMRASEQELMLYAQRLQLEVAQYKALREARRAMPEEIQELVALNVQPTISLVAEVQGGKVFRWKPGSKLTYCILRKSFGNGSQSDQRYAEVVADFAKAAKAWTDVPNASVPEYVHKQELDQSPLVGTPPGVTFTVRLINLPEDVIASAFFPNDPRNEWRVFIDPDEYFASGLAFDRVGVLRHELGHTLGLRHEHPRSEAPLVCQTLEVFEGDEISLTEYDPTSVMHYFCRGFNNPEQQTLNEERRKLQLTARDRAGIRLVYPPQGQASGFDFQDVTP